MFITGSDGSSHVQYSAVRDTSDAHAHEIVKGTQGLLLAERVAKTNFEWQI